MAKAVFMMGASSCIESYVVSRMLSEGPKVFAFDTLTCEALENFDLSVFTADCLQPFPTVVIELPADYAMKRVVPFEEGKHAPDFLIVRHEPEVGCVVANSKAYRRSKTPTLWKRLSSHSQRQGET